MHSCRKSEMCDSNGGFRKGCDYDWHHQLKKPRNVFFNFGESIMKEVTGIWSDSHLGQIQLLMCSPMWQNSTVFHQLKSISPLELLLKQLLAPFVYYMNNSLNGFSWLMVEISHRCIKLTNLPRLVSSVNSPKLVVVAKYAQVVVSFTHCLLRLADFLSLPRAGGCWNRNIRTCGAVLHCWGEHTYISSQDLKVSTSTCSFLHIWLSCAMGPWNVIYYPIKFIHTFGWWETV